MTVQSGPLFPQTNELLFTGRELDWDTQLYYYRARYYHPATGRFISEDPLGFAAGANFYTYANNNPVNANDPTGKWAGIDDLLFTVGGGAIGGVGQLAADAVAGKLSAPRDYIGAITGGAAAGEASLYTGPVGGALAGATAATLSKNGYDLLTGAWDDRSLAQRGVDTAVDFGASLIGSTFTGLSIAGISAGRNSLSAIADQMITKFENGTISTVSDLTAVKMVAGKAVNEAWTEASIFSGAVGDLYDATKEAVLGSGESPAPPNSDASFGGGAAAGGYLLYPNMPNNNSLQSAYAK